MSRRKKRAFEYKVQHREYKKNRKLFAQKLLDGVPFIAAKSCPDIAHITDKYRHIFEIESTADDAAINDIRPEV